MRELVQYTEQHRDRLIGIARDLVGIPSENTPPTGRERRAQEYVANFLARIGWEVDIYYPGEVRGLEAHPLYWKGRDYSGRPNVTGRRKGLGGGRSLLLSGHIDTVPRGSAEWTRQPFAGEIEGNCLYGRGACDMKAGVATSLFLAEAISQLDLPVEGDILVESVVDEEFGGVNGTLAGRLRGYLADAAVIGEPSGLRIIAAQRGGRVAHITFRAPGNMFADQLGGVVEQLRVFLNAVREFAARRAASAPPHPLYAHLKDPAPVAITKICTAPWGTSEPITVPVTCRVEMYWQAAPGETQEAVDREFFGWLDELTAAHSELFGGRPAVQFPYRWLPASTISPEQPLVTEMRASTRETMGHEAPVQGIEAPCDMYVFHQAFNMPAILWGARGANAHAADEYVEIDSLVDAARVLADFVTRWCGVRSSS
jgi:acetylornithine deacetylase